MNKTNILTTPFLALVQMSPLSFRSIGLGKAEKTQVF
jgi:hypothetical protein